MPKRAALVRLLIRSECIIHTIGISFAEDGGLLLHDTVGALLQDMGKKSAAMMMTAVRILRSVVCFTGR